MKPEALNIWYVAHYAGGPSVGRHSRGWSLAQNWQKSGARVTVILANRHHMLDGDQTAGTKTVQGVDYHFLLTPAYRNNGLMRIFNMFAFIASFRIKQRELIRLHGRPDAIIASSPHPFGFLVTHRLARSIGAKSVFEVRDLWHASIIEIMNVSPRHPLVMLIGAIERYAYAKADAVISLLPGTEDYMRARGLKGDRWHYIPNGAVLSTLEGSVQSSVLGQIEAWRRLGHIIVVYTGALGVPNNLDRLLEAMSELKGQGNSIRLAIVGRGDQENELQKQANDLQLGEVVQFFGQVSRDVARAVQEAADIGFIALKPSPVFQFGVSPNKVFDYMLAGIPIVAAIDADNDIVEQAGCGISIRQPGSGPIAAALHHLSSLSRDARVRMGRNGFDFLRKHHDYAVLAKTYMKILG